MGWGQGRQKKDYEKRGGIFLKKVRGYEKFMKLPTERKNIGKTEKERYGWAWNQGETIESENRNEKSGGREKNRGSRGEDHKNLRPK